jgi:RNA ligase (TIGR02306 family)
MSTFKISLEQINKVWPHPNADRLELASLAGMTFQFCVPKGEYQEGDEVIYFPIDAVLPESVIGLLGLTGKLSGAAHNRIKTVKLRGAISQGIVAKPSAFINSEFYTDEFTAALLRGGDFTELLSVVKYEPEPVSIRDGRLVPLPQLVQKYDIEGADRHPDIIELLMDEEVVITEKIEGSHFSASYYADGDYAVCQRNYRIMPVENNLHDWHKVAQELNLEKYLRDVFRTTGAKYVVTFRGEMVGPGIQGNIYGLKKHRIVFFELEIDGLPLDPLNAVGWYRLAGLEFVPVIDAGILHTLLNGKTVQQFSTGITVFPVDKGSEVCANILREGIVIRPVCEQWDNDFGRVIIKQRSPEYLENSSL